MPIPSKRRTSVTMNEYHPFLQVRKQYYETLAPPAKSENPHIISALRSDGIVKVPSLVSEDDLAEIRQGLDDRTKLLSSRFETHSSSFAQYWATYANGDIAHDARFDSFFQHPLLKDVTRGYVSKNCDSFDWGFSLKRTVDEKAKSDIYHFDSWKHRFKAILLLSDICADTGPTIFLKGTHKFLTWRLRPEYLYWTHRQHERADYVVGIDNFDGRVSEAENEQFREQYRFEESPLIGKAGDVFLADFRCLHKGTPLKRGHRLLAIQWYTAGI